MLAEGRSAEVEARREGRVSHGSKAGISRRWIASAQQICAKLILITGYTLSNYSLIPPYPSSSRTLSQYRLAGRVLTLHPRIWRILALDDTHTILCQASTLQNSSPDLQSSKGFFNYTQHLPSISYRPQLEGTSILYFAHRDSQHPPSDRFTATQPTAFRRNRRIRESRRRVDARIPDVGKEMDLQAAAVDAGILRHTQA